MKLKLLVFTILNLTFFSCKTTKLDIVEPKAEYNKPVLNTQPSTVGLNINVNIPELEKSLNASLNGLIYEDNDFTDDSRYVKVWKTAPIHFTIKNNVISYQLPIKIWVRTGFKKEVLGVTVEDYYEATGAMVINMNSAFRIQPDWNINTKSTVTDYKWTETPVIKKVGINIPVQTITDLVVYTFNNKIIKTVDQTITEKVDLRNTMIGKWKEFHDPIHANEDYDVWVRLQPKSLVMTPITASGNQMNFNIGLNAIFESYVGMQPDTLKTKTPLPDFKMVKAIQPAFSVNSNIEVPFSKVNALAKQFVVGQEFKKGNKAVKIDSINIWGQNEKLVVKVNVSGSVNGSIYCLGTLNLIDSTQTLKIENFDFEMATQNKLLKSANWLLHKSFLKLMDPMLTVSLKEPVKNMLTMSNDFLKNYKYDKGMYLNGRLIRIHLQKIMLSKEGFIISGKAEGMMRVDIKDWF